jgi:phosphohistidine phosphatase SixA
MKNIFLVLLFASALKISAQEKLTTFILVRHAEKMADGSKNPELSEEGKLRAARLADVLMNTPVSAIYSTDFIRTRSTVELLAKSKALEILLYDPFKKEDIAKMLEDYKGKTIVVCGHSNTTPAIANYLSGSESLKEFADSEYGNMLIVTVTNIGNASVTWLKF